MTNNKPKDFVFQQQGLKSFVKVKMDWANIDKVHLSFVAHEGQKSGCKQTAYIEAALKTNGPAREHALYFVESVLNGQMWVKREQSLQKQAETKAKYADAIFESNGGSPARGERPCIWRVVRLAPGSKAEYVLSAMEAEGIMNEKGGYSKKEGAPITRIDVAFSAEELLAFASVIKMAWQAYLCASLNFDAGDGRTAADDPSSSNGNVQVQSPETVYVVYDTLGELFETAITPQAALGLVQDSIKVLRQIGSGYKRRTNEEYEAAKDAILNGRDDVPVIPLKTDDGDSCEVIVVCRKPRK